MRNRFPFLAMEYVQPAAALLLLIVIWQIGCDLFKVPVWLLPSPVQIVVQTWEIRSILPLHILATFSEVAGGFVLAIVSGVPLAVIIVYSPLLRRVIYPLLLMIQSVPKVAV